MFGYIRPLEGELKIRQLQLYRSVYCGLCKCAGKNIGPFSRFFLNYDYTFFALVHMLLTGSDYKTGKARCPYHFFSKKDIVLDNPSLSLSAAIFSLLTYYKLCDTIKDEPFLKTIPARLLFPIVSQMRKKSLKNGYDDVDFIIRDCLEELWALEEKGVFIDKAAGIFGEMLGSLMKINIKEKETAEFAYSAGFETGRFIYCADALDDLFKDEKSKSFNPYLLEFGSADVAFREILKNKNSFFFGTDKIADILSEKRKNLSPQGKQLCEVCLNILYFGIPNTLEQIIARHENDSQRKAKKI